MYKEVLQYISRGIYPFHMPGHKGNHEFFPKNLLQFDITEIPDMDVLSSPQGIIKKLQCKIANFYGADNSYLLVNGSSSGIVAAICATCKEGATLVLPRNAHTSVYNAMALSGVNPVYVMPEITKDGLAGGLDPNQFNNIPHGAVVLVVSPTYEGFVSDIATIAHKVHSKGGVLIVDEAHGAHFAFNKAFPVSAINLGADIVVQSLHKTLPAFSQCAVLHTRGALADTFPLQFFINAMQTTSPSYMLLASCDYMLQTLWQQPELFENYVGTIRDVISQLPTCDTSLQFANTARVGSSAIFDVDISKLLFASYAPVCITEVANIMVNSFKIQPEMALGNHVLLMTSVADSNQGFARLTNAINGINQLYKNEIGPGPLVYKPPVALPQVALSPKLAMAMPTEEVPWDNAAGRIAAQLVAKYPPGVAIVAPGERIPANAPKVVKTVRVVV